MTEEQALAKLASACAKSEHCTFDIEQKLRKWRITPEATKRILQHLHNEKFIDDSRYTHYFVNDKIKFNKWGKYKILQALKTKRIPEEIYAPILAETEDTEYEERLLPLLQAKLRTMKASSDYETRQKLMRYALQRGFSWDQAERAIRKCL